MEISEILRKLGNIVSIGTVSQTKSIKGRSLARVKIFDRETDFLPALSLVNSFFKVYSPMRVGEQVVVLSPFGEASSGIIIRSIFNKGAKEPEWANDTTAGLEFEDGTVITYDTEAKELKVNAVNKISIFCKAATVNADTVDITATTSNTGDVTINGKLKVTEEITGLGGLAISGGNGASVDGDISTTGNITDSKGDLTDHGHNDSDGGTSNPR